MPEAARVAGLRSGTSRGVCVLLIGGLDPSGGAGVSADGEALRDRGFEFETVLTASTDQDDREVRGVGAHDPSDWHRRALAITEGRRVDGIKFGLLPGREHVRQGARLVERLRASRPDLPVVVDPVLASSSGFTFLDRDAQVALCTELVPLGVFLTPNLPEALQLVGGDPERLEDLVADPVARPSVARQLIRMGALGVVLKGGHGDEQPARDLVLEREGQAAWIEHERIVGGGIRGSGCRHASVVAGELARGADLPAAARSAADYVAARIRAAGAN